VQFFWADYRKLISKCRGRFNEWDDNPECKPQTIIILPNKTGFMKRSAIALILVIALVILTGCTQSQPAAIPQPDVTQVTVTQPPFTATAPITTSAPVVTVTIIRYVVPEKAWKDTSLQITFKAPQDWSVTTRQLSTPEGSQGLLYQTDLVAGDVFYIQTFPISRNQDQDYRNAFRKWGPAPEESTVTINSIVYDRFESTNNGRTQVGYVARKASASDIGYSSVIYYITDGSTPFEREDFETVVESFAYLAKDKAQSATGYEIPRVR
jgi:hypothetical protein